MRKLVLFTLAFTVMTFVSNAQENKFTAGVNVGLPLGDIKDAYNVNFGVDVAYNFSLVKNLEGGLGVGYSHFVAKGQTFPKIEDVGLIPVYASLKFLISDSIFVGTDLGYGIGISPDGNDGGLFYQPKFGYRSDEFDVFLGYKNFSVDDSNFSSINVGINYTL